MHIYYVYRYLDPRNGRIFYIGKGKGDRKDIHLICAKKNIRHGNAHLINLIKQILKDGLEPVIEIVQNDMSESAALDLEKQMIAFHGRKMFDVSGTLCNIFVGGNFGVGCFSKEYRTKLSESHKGIKFSKERCSNISFAKKGKKNTLEHNNNVSIAVKKRWNNDADLRTRHNAAVNDSSRNRSKIWLVEDIHSNTIFEILNLTSWCRNLGWDKNDGQQLYRTLKRPEKMIDNKYKSNGYRLLNSCN